MLLGGHICVRQLGHTWCLLKGQMRRVSTDRCCQLDRLAGGCKLIRGFISKVGADHCGLSFECRCLGLTCGKGCLQRCSQCCGTETKFGGILLGIQSPEAVAGVGGCC